MTNFLATPTRLLISHAPTSRDTFSLPQCKLQVLSLLFQSTTLWLLQQQCASLDSSSSSPNHNQQAAMRPQSWMMLLVLLIDLAVGLAHGWGVQQGVYPSKVMGWCVLLMAIAHLLALAVAHGVVSGMLELLRGFKCCLASRIGSQLSAADKRMSVCCVERTQRARKVMPAFPHTCTSPSSSPSAASEQTTIKATRSADPVSVPPLIFLLGSPLGVCPA